MSIDIYHYKLTLEEPESDNQFFLIDDFENNCNVSIDHYAKFIADIKVYTYEKSIAIVKNMQELEILASTKRFNEMNCLKVFVGPYDEIIKAQYLKYFADNNFNPLRTLILKQIHEGLQVYKVLIGEYELKRGAYYEDLAHEGKIVNEFFYPYFKKYMLWGNKADVEFAHSCVRQNEYDEDLEPDSINATRNRFKRDFVDDFVFGESLFCVG